jgi:hypothetical protein
VTESALLAIKISKLEFQLKTFYHAALFNVEVDAMEDTLHKLGLISEELALLQDGFTTQQDIVLLTSLLPAITM